MAKCGPAGLGINLAAPTAWGKPELIAHSYGGRERHSRFAFVTWNLAHFALSTSVLSMHFLRAVLRTSHFTFCIFVFPFLHFAFRILYFLFCILHFAFCFSFCMFHFPFHFSFFAVFLFGAHIYMWKRRSRQRGRGGASDHFRRTGRQRRLTS